MISAIARFFGHGKAVAFSLVGGLLVVTGATTGLFVSTVVGLRFQRDIARLVFEDDRELLERARAAERISDDALRLELDAPEAPDGNYIVLSIADHRLWYKKGDETLYTTEVATGSGKTIVSEGGRETWKFDTPRGRLIVRSKEEDPMWVPPDWHYVEQARKRGMPLMRVGPEGQKLADGSMLQVDGENLVRVSQDGTRAPLSADEGREIVADGKLVVPPVGTSQRRYKGVLGTHLLSLGDGYALHGTNDPASIGHSASHGCVRLRNADIAKLYDMVAVGTPVYIY
jgi:lipoprotein-anchoring transpeptidase ErfK/SrfK